MYLARATASLPMSRWFLYLEYLDITTSGGVYLRGDTSDQLFGGWDWPILSLFGIDPNVDSHNNSGWKPVMALVEAKVVVMMAKMVQQPNQCQ